ncbi:hypothetical protein NST84_18215 [Paenibacillus sp. FSL R7-0345]|uniref:hypothetical protein n=1 Tax=Paenibacillus sp. FSL R7-0345 TaxID=2954535 RepID=UPI00315998B9
MDKKIIFVKVCPFTAFKTIKGENVKILFELSMYNVKRDYFARTTYKGKFVSDYVNIDTYGILVTEIYEENGDIFKCDPIDLGVKTAIPRHVSALINELCRTPIKDINAIRDAYEAEASSDVWCAGWPDALARTASIQLSRNLSSTNLPPISEKVRKKREKLLEKLNPFRDLPKPDKDYDKGSFDA